jgi:hypothetical protein
MRKRNTIFIVASLGVLIGAYIFMATRPSATPDTFTKAKATKATAKCLEADTTLNIPTDELADIEMAAVTYLIDVPAGTDVDVKIATLSNDKLTGSDHYPTKYGNYNFAMAKQSGSWVVTDFKRCS